MASGCIESIHNNCDFQLNTQTGQSEKSCSGITRAEASLVPSKKKRTINVPIACSIKKFHEELRKLQTRSIITSSLSASGADNFSPTPPTAEKLDQWMKQSIFEILRHIQDAPFLHYVFDEKSPSSRRGQKVPPTYISQEAAGEGWGMLRNCITSICPDGVIYVQKLNPECKCQYCYSRRGSGDGGELEGGTDMWGLVIQGRGGGFTGCASYILKTTMILSPNGRWTQFSLVRAKCFGECPCTQFIRSWLFQSHEV